MIVHLKTRPSTSLRVLFDIIEESGLDTQSCLQGTGLSEKELNDPAAVHTTEQEIKAIQNFVRLKPDNVGLGAELGRRMHVNAFGIWGFAILTSPTLRTACEISVEYVQLSFVIADMKLTEANGRGHITFDMSGLPQDIHRFLLERQAMVAVNFIRELLQQPTYNDFEIETVEPRPDFADALFENTSIPVRGGAPGYALSFPLEVLDQPLPKSDPVTLKFCLDQCKALLEQQKRALPLWSQKVHDAILEDIGKEQKIDDIADRLSVTERTLRRRLTDEGTSFRDLYTDARMAIAYELLDVAGLSIETVSWRVGYAEPASFARAFSKKYGKTPGEVRRRKD